MSKSLIIAEKPSVARDLASALGRVGKKESWFENDTYVISSAIGHLVELYMPEDFDKKLGFWRLQSLPIVPEQFKVKVIEKTKSKYQELKKLMMRKDVSEVINACDAGREGELIFTYVYEAAKCRKPVKRLWMQSMTLNAIHEAFSNLRAGEEMRNLQDAARCRSEADWLIGINGTRAVTARVYGRARGNTATVGRVQTPTLNLVVEREQRIREFKSRSYWRIVGLFSITEGEYEGVYQRADFKAGARKQEGTNGSTQPDDRADRVWVKEDAERVRAELEKARVAQVTEEKKRSKQISPRLYDLTTLQREANSRHGLSARHTLQIAQSLYEEHKLITYPRTDSRALPEDYQPTCRKILERIEGDLKPHAGEVLNKGWVRPNRRIFNNAQISDHFAIIPTGEGNKALDGTKAKIYDMISRRFVATFHPPAEFDVTTRLSKVADHTFKTEGKVLVNPGWMSCYGREAEGEDTLPALSPQDGSPAEAGISEVEITEQETKPPPRYTEATLLSAMEGAGKLVDDEELALAMKEKGLGTPATRAQTIEQLINQNYVERDRRNLLPTAKADHLLGFLDVVKADVLTSPTMTGEWEHELHQIERGQMTRAQFMKGIVDLTQSIVEKAKSYKEEDSSGRETSIVSPTDGKPFVETLRTYRSQDGAYVIYKIVANRKLEESEVEGLVSKGQIGPLDGFKSKAGKPFSAILKLNDEKKVEFVFEDRGDGQNNGDGEALDLTQCPVVGQCPKDGKKVYSTPRAFACESSLNGKRECKFRISRQMLGQTLGEEQIRKLLENGKTDLIENFRSKRTKKYFSAYLILKDNRDIGFEFPPRAKKKTAKKTAAKKKTKEAG